MCGGRLNFYGFNFATLVDLLPNFNELESDEFYQNACQFLNTYLTVCTELEGGAEGWPGAVKEVLPTRAAFEKVFTQMVATTYFGLAMNNFQASQ